jgi:cbb3-type cytochrome oxidase cytochrome c subunit
MAVVFGAVALFVLVTLVGLVGPSLQAETPGALSSEISYTQLAAEGQDFYANLGCAACHTQMVRPVIADVGLGAVTLNDSNQILGTRRFGPDLSNVGSRVTSTQLQAAIEGQLSGHPSYNLGPQDMSALVAYLSESVTTEGDG